MEGVPKRRETGKERQKTGKERRTKGGEGRDVRKADYKLRGKIKGRKKKRK